MPPVNLAVDAKFGDLVMGLVKRNRKQKEIERQYSEDSVDGNYKLFRLFGDIDDSNNSQALNGPEDDIYRIPTPEGYQRMYGDIANRDVSSKGIGFLTLL